MNELTIITEFDSFYPGNEVLVTGEWTLAEPPEAIELRLVWHTTGKGDRDLKVVHSQVVQHPAAQGRHEFSLTLPWGPYSFSGKLISLIWGLELVALPGEESTRKEIVIGPGTKEVVLGGGGGGGEATGER